MTDARLFRAKLTAKTNSGGTWLYSWKEQIADLTTGADTDPLAFRSGIATINPAVELNNAEVDADTFVWMRERGFVAGQMWYEFAAPDGSGSGDGSGGCGWVAGLAAVDCLEATIISTSGRCDCPDEPVCGDCPGGSPDTWTVDMAGFTCSPVVHAGTLTVTRSSGCTWTGTWGGLPVTVEPNGSNLQLRITGIGVYITNGSWGCCGPVVLERDQADGCDESPATLTLTAGGPCPPPNAPQRVKLTSADGARWSGGTISVCGTDYTLAFSIGTCSDPCLTLTGATASAPTYPGVRESCGPNSAVFAFGDPAICTGEVACGGPANNVLRVRVRWINSCLWAGPGWYCVRDCGSEEACEAVELLEGDQYDDTIEICSGPYEDEAAAEEVCPVTVPGVTGPLDCGAGLFLHEVGVTYSVTVTIPSPPGSVWMLFDTEYGKTYQVFVTSSPDQGFVSQTTEGVAATPWTTATGRVTNACSVPLPYLLPSSPTDYEYLPPVSLGVVASDPTYGAMRSYLAVRLTRSNVSPSPATVTFTVRVVEVAP